MADKKLSELTALTGANLADVDEFLVVDKSDTTMAASGTDKRIVLSELKSGLVVESLREKYLKPTGSYENWSRANGIGNQAVLTSGLVALTAIALPNNFLVTSISFCSGSTAAVTPTNWWFSLCNNAYVTLRSTANQTTTAWAANTVKTVNLTSTFTTTYEGLHYLAIMMTAATLPSIQGAAMTPTASMITPGLAVVGLASQTTPPANGTNLSPSPVGKSTNPWAYVL